MFFCLFYGDEEVLVTCIVSRSVVVVFIIVIIVGVVIPYCLNCLSYLSFIGW